MEHVSSARPTGKFPEKVENLKRWARFPGWNFRTECRVPFTFLVVCTSSISTVEHREVPGFKTKWNKFLPIGNSTFAPTEKAARENWETPISPCHYRKGYTPTKPLCLCSCSKTRWDRTTPSTCHPCIASAQHSAKASDSAGAPITTDSCASSYPPNNTGGVRTSTKSKPCSPDNSVRKNCEASRTLESVCASVLHSKILICRYYSCCSFVVFS